MLRIALCALVTLLSPTVVIGQQEDHPLVSRYQGSEVDRKDVEEFAQYRLITGLNGNEFEGREVEGKVTRIVYRNPADRSTLEIFRNYRSALEAADMEPLFTCEMDACGPAYARSAWGRYNGLFVAADGDPRYIAGVVRTRTGTAYVALLVGRARTQLDVVEVRAMEGDMVVADAAALKSGLERDGRVSVYGIFFDTDRAEVKPESRPALEAIAEVLRDSPQLRLFVVGHTDMTGDLAHNQQLSEARARAVVSALVEQFGVASARLDGYGVGPLSPAATNDTEEGRRLNRRVELVARR